MPNNRYYKKVEKINKYSLPRKTMFALTFGRVHSNRLVGRATASYVLHLV